MNRQYRLTNEHLFEALDEWDTHLKRKALVVACGGTALTLNGYKESTKDVDFLHPDGTWIFQLYQGQTIFQTELLDPVQVKGDHNVIRKYKHLVLGSLNSADLIISKMFRGDDLDVQDCISLLQSEPLDLRHLAQRYKETADYYYNPTVCKKNLQYLIEAMVLVGMEPKPLKEMSKQWNP